MLALLTLPLLVLSACMSYESEREIATAQIGVGARIFEEIELGVTTSKWLATRLGNPNNIAVDADGGETWHYQNTIIERTSFKALPILSARRTEQHFEHFRFTFVDGKLTRFGSVRSPTQL